MSWQSLLGHQDAVDRFRLAKQNGRLGNAYLLVGPTGVGKRYFARVLAKSLLCLNASEDLEACGICESCREFQNGVHPDFYSVACPEDRRVLPLELLVGDREHRAREGLCFWMRLAAIRSGRKVAVIEDADALADEGANALLKTLEEPPANSVLLLVSHNLQRQLPTIRSRCQLVLFSALNLAHLTALILKSGLAESEEAAQQLAAMSNGSLDIASELSDPAWFDFHEELSKFMTAETIDPVTLASEVNNFVEQAGTTLPERRTRLRQVLRFAVDSLREQLRDAVVDNPEQVSRQRKLMQALDQCVTTLVQVDSNAHPATAIDSWAGSLR